MVTKWSQTCQGVLAELIEEPAVVSKRGVYDGNQIGRCSLQPAKESRVYYNISYIAHCNRNKRKIQQIDRTAIFAYAYTPMLKGKFITNLDRWGRVRLPENFEKSIENKY